MPLIIISGYPTSGKTHRAQQLVTFFNEKINSPDASPQIKNLKIHHISDDSLGLSRSVYSSARAEKDARATFSSAIKRHLSPNTLVIADGMNYIKGFRYQLYCEAKAIPTPHCVLHIATPPSQCITHNTTRFQTSPVQSYPPSVHDNLIYRYEEPNGMTRWDSPLFTIPYTDALPPLPEIWEALFNPSRAVKPNAATVLRPAAEQDYLYELDKMTSDVIGCITAWQADHAGEGGGDVPVVGGGDGEGDGKVVMLPMQAPSLPQLQRLRRQFITLNRQHTLSKSRIRDLFVDYLNDNFQS